VIEWRVENQPLFYGVYDISFSLSHWTEDKTSLR